jgi:dsDNA-binding SOS-regulon protein
MSWEDWLMNNGHIKGVTAYDKIMELAVSSYDMTSKSRKQYKMDIKHYLVLWWVENKEEFLAYNSTIAVGKLLDIDHSTVIHFMYHRKKTINYEKNVECIKDFLN